MGAKISVHVGAHKTASTHFQKMLRRNEDRLRASGTTVLLPRELRKGAIPMQKIAAGALKSDPVAIDAGSAAFWDAIAGASNVLLSDENMLGSAHNMSMRKIGKFYPDGHVRLHRLLSGLGISEATVFLAIRDPAHFFVSAYSQRVTSRGYVRFDSFLGELDVCTIYWSEFVERMKTCPGVGRLVVWRYEDYPNIAPVVLREMLPEEVAETIDLKGRVTHSGLSAAAHLKIELAERSGTSLSSADIRVIRAALPKGDAGPGYMPFDVNLLHDSARYYEEDLADIARLPGVTLLGYQGS
ncbi:MAG: hypothetical protein AAGK37_22580 [Pseudomonadota bacterium]